MGYYTVRQFLLGFPLLVWGSINNYLHVVSKLRLKQVPPLTGSDTFLTKLQENFQSRPES